MTRKSKREIECSLNDLDSRGTFSLREYFWADLKDYHNGDLSSAERRLLDAPDAHLSTEAQQHQEQGECR
jgi:hypothetical protein